MTAASRAPTTPAPEGGQLDEASQPATGDVGVPDVSEPAAA